MTLEEHSVISPWRQLVLQLRSRLRNRAEKRRGGLALVKKWIFGAFPILDWLFHYDIKKCLVGDLISGFTVGILTIPQGMAYGVLAGTESIYGLYASFFPVLMYTLICTSHHASVGTFAVISLMTGGIVHSLGQDIFAGRVNTSLILSPYNSTVDPLNDPVPLEIRVQVMVAVTLATGVWEIVFGILRFGHLAVFLSDHLIKGFTCAAAFHVFTSQIKLVFGMPKLKERYGPLKLVFYYYDFFAAIKDAHVPTVVVSVICIPILYFTRVLITQNPRVMKIIKIPVPIELLVMIFATLASYYLRLSDVYGVSTITHIPQGLPLPQLPPYQIMPEIMGGTFSIAVVASAILISLAKIYATKHRYSVDDNQELIALGAANVFGGVFMCLPTSGGLARSAVQDSVGGSTQLVSIVSALLVLIVLVALGKYLEPLPRAVLGSVIMVSLLTMLNQLTEIYRLWKISLIDASIFIVTFLSTLLLDVDLGLAIGVLYSLLTFAFRLQYGRVATLGHVRGATDDIRPLHADPAVDEFLDVKVFRLYGPLYSGSAERFVRKVRRSIEAREECQPPSLKEIPSIASMQSEILEMHDVIHATERRRSRSHSTANAFQPAPVLNDERSLSMLPLRGLVIDCSAMNFVDVVGAEALKSLAKECHKKKIKIILAVCSDIVKDLLVRAGLFEIDSPPIFARSVTEAVATFA